MRDGTRGRPGLRKDGLIRTGDGQLLRHANRRDAGIGPLLVGFHHLLKVSHDLSEVLSCMCSEHAVKNAVHNVQECMRNHANKKKDYRDGSDNKYKRLDPKSAYYFLERIHSATLRCTVRANSIIMFSRLLLLR